MSLWFRLPVWISIQAEPGESVEVIPVKMRRQHIFKKDKRRNAQS